MDRVGIRDGLFRPRMSLTRRAHFAAILITRSMAVTPRLAKSGAVLLSEHSMLKLNVKAELDLQARAVAATLRKQVDFAKAQALNIVAREVIKAEQANIRSVFERPKPFTQNSLGLRAATKNNPVAVIFMKDITAKYLRPYEEGGAHVLPGRALLNPKNIKLDQYGQLPKSTLARLKARPDIFIGPVKTKAGIVNGVWQRSVTPSVKVKGPGGKALRGANKTGRLKLLIRFGDALQVRKQLRFGATAKRIVDARLSPAFAEAMARAAASAR